MSRDAHPQAPLPLSGRMTDLRCGLCTPPNRRALRIGLAALAIHLIITGFIGFGTHFMRFAPLHAPPRQWLPLPFMLLLFPSMLEELLFRGMLIPHRARAVSIRYRYMMIAFSTLVFLLWHPLQALVLHPPAMALFTDPRFLGIVVVLGITCGIAYAESGIIWIPIVIHWVSLLLWLFLFGGSTMLLPVLS